MVLKKKSQLVLMDENMDLFAFLVQEAPRWADLCLEESAEGSIGEEFKN